LIGEHEPTDAEIEAFVAGELDGDAADRVRAAMVRDPRVAAEVEEILQLRAAVVDAEPAAARGGARDELAARRKRRRPVLVVATVAAAAAAVVIAWVVLRPPGKSTRPAAVAVAEEVRGALAARRGFEPRLSWAAIDGHRPYDAPRAAGPAVREGLPLELLARVEKLGDPSALVAAQLATGNLDQAARVLDAAPESPALASDRAALDLFRGEPELALVHVAAALAKQPDNVQARWNRALALAQLGLDRSAAAELDAIAALGEPGWADEARARAEGLRGQRRRSDDASAAASAAGDALVAGGAPPLDLVGPFPDRMRLYFYDAVRTASTAERIAALRPMANALDTAFGETTLAALLDRVAASNLGRRAPLAARYAEIRAKRDAAGAAQLATAAERAGAHDIAIGALLFTGLGRVDPSLLDRYRALAARTIDPWFELAAIEQEANAAVLAYDRSRAESLLAPALERCRPTKLVLRCDRIGRLLVDSYIALHRYAAAHEHLGTLLRSARATNNPVVEHELLKWSADLATWRDDVTTSWQPVADAYLAEWALGETDTCAADRLVRETRAQALINRHRNTEARAVFAGEPTCPAAPTTEQQLSRLFVLAHLTAEDPALLAPLRRDLATLRASPELSEPRRVLVDHVEGRALLASDPAAARDFLKRAVSAPDRSPGVAQARTYSYAALIDEAAARGAWSETADLFAQELGTERAAPCTVGASVDREETYVAVRADGAALGSRAPVTRLGATAVPAPVLAALDGCAHVTVVARGSYHGRPRLLPADRSWSFRSARRSAGAAVTADRAGPTLIVTGAQPPARLELAALVPLAGDLGAATVIEGAGATPDRVLAGLLDASYAELHAHGLLGAEGSDASYLVLSPDAAGRYALTADAVAGAGLRRHPVVVLAACHAAVTGTAHHGPGGLADAFIAAGASAVIASPEPIADADAGTFFAGLRSRIAAGIPPSQALRDEREAWTDPRARSWIDALVVFE
jgi:hypothetical protein